MVFHGTIFHRMEDEKVNEEFGINFQRINMILACFMSLTFFFYVSGPFLNYPLFARKHLKNIITGSRETVQIIRM